MVILHDRVYSENGCMYFPVIDLFYADITFTPRIFAKVDPFFQRYFKTFFFEPVFAEFQLQGILTGNPVRKEKVVGTLFRKYRVDQQTVTLFIFSVITFESDFRDVERWPVFSIQRERVGESKIGRVL